MKGNILKPFLLMVALLIGCLFSSCDKDDDELQPSYDLNGTVWIHQFKPEDHVSYAAKALVFGRNNVDCFYLDSTFKVTEHSYTVDYKIDGSMIEMGMSKYPFNDYSFACGPEWFYRSDLKPSDVLIR